MDSQIFNDKFTGVVSNFYFDGSDFIMKIKDITYVDQRNLKSYEVRFESVIFLQVILKMQASETQGIRKITSDEFPEDLKSLIGATENLHLSDYTVVSISLNIESEIVICCKRIVTSSLEI